MLADALREDAASAEAIAAQLALARALLPALPPLCARLPLAAVVGGHAGLLVDAASRAVLKPLLGVRGAREAAFYALAAQCSDGPCPPRDWMPRALGVLSAACDIGGAEQTFLALEDLTARFARPCVLDVKMGTRGTGDDASAAKVAHDAAKWPPMARLGLRVTGMRVWRSRGGGACDVCRGGDGAGATVCLACSGTAGIGDGGVWVEHGRSFGQSLDESTMARVFDEFIGGGAMQRRDILLSLRKQVQGLTSWFARQTDFRFHGASLLIIYEGAPVAGVAADSLVDLRLIDFAHVWPARGERDVGFLTGLGTLERLVELAMA
jgi:hypothetical protein